MSNFTKDFEIEFIIDGVKRGSGFLMARNGELLTECAEEEFYKTLRKNSKSLLKEANDLEREYIIDHLTHSQEEKLREEHAKDYHGTDDDMSDSYEDWLINLDLQDLKNILENEQEKLQDATNDLVK